MLSRKTKRKANMKNRQAGQILVGDWHAKNYIDLGRAEERRLETRMLNTLNEKRFEMPQSLPAIFSKQKRVLGQVSIKSLSKAPKSKLFGKKVEPVLDADYEP